MLDFFLPIIIIIIIIVRNLWHTCHLVSPVLISRCRVDVYDFMYYFTYCKSVKYGISDSLSSFSTLITKPYRVAQKTGPPCLIANILKIP